jgi:threonine dehydrogenase-like Zn-dependent dehydrogenase
MKAVVWRGVEQTGSGVRGFSEGDRVVVVCSTISCGTCLYCRAGYYAQCDRANPNGPSAGIFFGSPGTTGSLDGVQAQRARIPPPSVKLVSRSGSKVKLASRSAKVTPHRSMINAYENFDSHQQGWLETVVPM